MRAGTQKVRNTENGARVHSPLCYLLTVKNTEMTGGELSRQWNTQPARPTTGSPACSDTHIRRERQPQNLQESAAHRSQTPVRGTIHCLGNSCLGNSYASATSRRCSACRYSRRSCLPSTSCGTQPTRSTRLQHARTPARHEPPPSRPYAPCTPHASAHESGE